MLGKGLRGSLVGGLCALVAIFASANATAFEFFDGKVQIHGYAEMQMRSIANDFETSDGWDLTQWYNILNVEIEWDVAEDGWGPFDYISAFARIEARYDCVWTRGCGMINNANAFGDRATHLPRRLSSSRRAGWTGGNLKTGDVRRRHRIALPDNDFTSRDTPVGDRHRPGLIWNVAGIEGFFNVTGPDAILGNNNDPALYTFAPFLDPGSEFMFASRKIPGTADGSGTQMLGPWLPKNKIDPIGSLRDRVNPFRPGDVHPIYGFSGSELPFRQAPLFGPNDSAPEWEAQGLFLPNASVAEEIRHSRFDTFDQNFRQAELAWNHGASQQDEKELKEAYIDLEMFDGRLWMRAGKQSIIWGKTELLRTTDQFNPQDLALASLPSLEESRIALWSARFVYSFYDIGPLEDVRFEVAMNLDQFEPTDLGRCGEPYTPLPVCTKTFGLFGHGALGIGVAGEFRPPNPWDSWKGIEFGARLEFRTGRFSFAISDFWGYEDFPTTKQLFSYSRNVDPFTGRPRRTENEERCLTGEEPACLRQGTDSLRFHHANQDIFHTLCSATLFFSTLDTTVCSLAIFNSQGGPLAPGVPNSKLISALLAGSPTVASLLFIGAVTPFTLPLVRLNSQAVTDITSESGPGNGGAIAGIFQTLSQNFTPQQEALFGCGPFYNSHCDDQGVDLMNGEASVWLQSFVGFEGTLSRDTHDNTVSQPGTVGFIGGPVATRFVEGMGTIVLPGARTVLDANYDPSVDGCVGSAAALAARGITISDPGGVCAASNLLLHPFTNQVFLSEAAATSFNLMLFTTANDSLFDGQAHVAGGGNPSLETCSIRAPTTCSGIRGLFTIAGLRRNDVEAGGNDVFGRREFVWHGGGTVAVDYNKRNVLGFALDFAEDVTRTSWGFEATWINNQQIADNNAHSNVAKVDQYNLSVAVDRPTFIRFLNVNRTFFFNSQWFFQYLDGWREDMGGSGPWNMTGTFLAATGYFQDRLLPSFLMLYDFRSNSGAILPSVTYRFSERFSAQIGVAGFFGHFEQKRMPINDIANPTNHVGREAYNLPSVENGIAAVRDRDEIFLRIRYTY